jgi:hypothetical protein
LDDTYVIQPSHWPTHIPANHTRSRWVSRVQHAAPYHAPSACVLPTTAQRYKLRLKAKGLEPGGFHFIVSRVETRRLSSYGSTGFANLYRPTTESCSPYAVSLHWMAKFSSTVSLGTPPEDFFDGGESPHHKQRHRLDADETKSRVIGSRYRAGQ